MNKWEYLIVSLYDGEILGTNSLYVASEASYLEGYVVIDICNQSELFGGIKREVTKEAILNEF